MLLREGLPGGQPCLRAKSTELAVKVAGLAAESLEGEGLISRAPSFVLPVRLESRNSNIPLRVDGWDARPVWGCQGRQPL